MKLLLRLESDRTEVIVDTVTHELLGVVVHTKLQSISFGKTECDEACDYIAQRRVVKD